jgi:hypothetical protein
MADRLGLWGWAIFVAFMALVSGVAIFRKVFKKTGGINDVSHDDALAALHALGGTCLVWDANPVGDGSLEIGSLHLEDRTGKPVRFGWAARCCEDDADALAHRYSAVPGHYVLALPSGTVISAPSKDLRERRPSHTNTTHNTTVRRGRLWASRRLHVDEKRKGAS